MESGLRCVMNDKTISGEALGVNGRGNVSVSNSSRIAGLLCLATQPVGVRINLIVCI